jgi:hypothetical protein
MHKIPSERFETAIVAASPMWGLLEDHAVIAIDVSADRALALALEEALEASSALSGEWVRTRGHRLPAAMALRIDLGLARDSGVDLTLDAADPVRAEDLEALANYDLVEIWVEDNGELAGTFRVRPRGRDILEAIFERSGALG